MSPRNAHAPSSSPVSVKGGLMRPEYKWGCSPWLRAETGKVWSFLMGILIRITRHDLQPAAEAFLRSVFGHDLQIVTDDVPYGDNPVGVVNGLIKLVEKEHGDKVVAVEATAPFDKLMKLV